MEVPQFPRPTNVPGSFPKPHPRLREQWSERYGCGLEICDDCHISRAGYRRCETLVKI